jgi:RNA polymerase sigma-70 factor (ECF subfamily)
MVQEDLALVQRILNLQTREEGFRELVKMYQSKLYWLIRGMTTDHADTDDILQNTFLKVARYLSTYKGEAALLTWMVRIAINECHSFQSVRKRTRQVENELRKQDEPKTFQETDSSAAMDMLQHAIRTLPEKQRIVFCLRYFEGLPYETMAQMTDTSIGALKASYHHAVKKIEEYIVNENTKY